MENYNLPFLQSKKNNKVVKRRDVHFKKDLVCRFLSRQIALQTDDNTFLLTWKRVSTCAATRPVQGKNSLNLSVWVGTMPSVEMFTLGLSIALLGACMKVILYGTAEPFFASQVKSMWSTAAGMTCTKSDDNF